MIAQGGLLFHKIAIQLSHASCCEGVRFYALQTVFPK